MTLPLTRTARTLAMALLLGVYAFAHGATLQDVNRLMKQGRSAQALEQVDAYLAGKPGDAQGRFLKGLLLNEMNRPAEAIAVFQKLTEDYPDLPEPYNNLAVIYAQQKQYEKAKQALELAIRTHPSYATAHENLGDIYARLASQAYDKALQIDSSNASAQTKLAMIRDLVANRPAPAAKPAPMPETPPAKPVETRPVETVPVVVAKAPEPKPVEPKPVDAKPVEPKPVPSPAPVAERPADDVAKAVQAWAAAWSAKDVKAYLAHYAADFDTPRGQNRQNWETERAQRIDKPGAISVTVDALRVTFDSPDKATARFRQHYRSATFKTSGTKLLVLVRRNNRWLIQQERIK